MQNTEFDRRVKELMEGHLEMPDADSWENLQRSLVSRKRAKVVFYRRTVIGSVAVAASLFLFLFLGKQTPVKVNYNDNNIAGNSVRQDVPVEKIDVLPDKETKILTFASSRRTKTSVPVSKTEELTTVPVENTDQPVSSDNPVSTNCTEKAASPEKKAKYGYNDFQEEPVKKSFMQRLKYGLSTNLSPSIYDKSISMLSVSLGYQNDFVSSSLKETLQPQSVSDTKFAMPLSFGVQAQLPINERFSIGAGLCYSLLVSQYENYSYNSRRDIQQSLHYLGVPVNVYYDLLQKKNLKVYVVAGATLEKGISANYRVVDNGVKSSESTSISGVQFSLSGGLGAEFMLGNDMGLYFDPAMSYYFKCGQPENIRTAQRFQYKFELGMRFHL